MKVLVTGAHGLLGSEFVFAARARGFEVTALGRAALDVTDTAAVEVRFRDERPDVVVHCAAYTAVDRAESEPEIAMTVNRDGSENVAAAAAMIGARIVYISTDYVFDGAGGGRYSPTDATSPLSAYGRSKLAGEAAVLGIAAGPGGASHIEDGVARVSDEPVGTSALIVRTGWLYGAGGRNFVETMLGLAERGQSLSVVDDQVGRPTWARNVAEVVLDLVDSGVSGVWHVADGGQASWLDFAREVFDVRGLSVDIEGVTTASWGADAPRPLFSVLDLEATESAVGRPMMDWREALRRYLTVDEDGQ